MDILAVIVRILHVGSAIALLGGTLYVAAILAASTRVLDEGLRTSILEAARRRFYRISHPALILLLVTGFYAFIRDMPIYKEIGPASHGLLGVKILLAVLILGIVFAQTFKALKGSPLMWAKINLAMGTIIIVLAAIVRQMRVEHFTQ